MLPWGQAEEYTGNRSPIGRASSDLRLLRLSTAGHRPFHVAHKTYLSSRKCLLICDAAQNGHSLHWNHTCNPNAKERVQGASAQFLSDEALVADAKMGHGS